ncbi:PREDICTED: leucine-rich repeat extensin-like protein 2 [Nicrophorus vespilloides]|uniref:Leucine-rich repeat extensin-like protein 2 n=1 Tax=Nicrophorus vespilloides TaxID=110193 RepID=A0ABM1NBU0_NICVS|nr:PREDICTED: leucine-rich repeat extensin-like protein 2 [Nicrophorus vespilloides]
MVYCARGLLVLVLLAAAVLHARAMEKVTRDKRTLDLVLRSVADVFGYDVQKRPTVLPPPPLPPAKPTFFPPPLKPLPPPARRFFPAPKAVASPPPAQTQAPAAVAPAAPAPAVPPVAPVAPAPAVPPAAPVAKPPVAAAPAPAAPVAKPIAAVPAPAAQSPAANSPMRRPVMRPLKAVPNTPPARPPPPPRPTVPPLLTENIRKTFNIAFNYNRGIQTQAPPVPAAPPAPPAPAAQPAPPPPPSPAAPAAPPPPPPPPQRPVKSRPRPFRPPQATPAKQPPPTTAIPPPPPPPPTTTKTPPPPPPMNLPPPPPKAPVAPKPAQQTEYEDDEDYYQNYDNRDNEAYYDYADAEQPAQPAPADTRVNYEDSKQRFRQSVEAFWEGSPWIQQNNGYKYLTNPEEPAKYEEYELPEESQQKKRKYPKKAIYVKPQYYGTLPAPLHQLDGKQHPGAAPSPFDAESAATEIKAHIQEAQPVVSKYVPDSYDANFSFEMPEPQPFNYTQHERLTAYEDSDSDLSPNSHRSESQSNKHIMFVSSQPNITQTIIY